MSQPFCSLKSQLETPRAKEEAKERSRWEQEPP